MTQQGAQSQNPENQENDEDDILSSSPNINRSLKILDYNTLKIYQIFFSEEDQALTKLLNSATLSSLRHQHIVERSGSG